MITPSYLNLTNTTNGQLQRKTLKQDFAKCGLSVAGTEAPASTSQ
jgi:hypothetical protein